jgi:hypothetical protein
VAHDQRPGERLLQRRADRRVRRVQPRPGRRRLERLHEVARRRAGPRAGTGPSYRPCSQRSPDASRRRRRRAAPPPTATPAAGGDAGLGALPAEDGEAPAPVAAGREHGAPRRPFSRRCPASASWARVSSGSDSRATSGRDPLLLHLAQRGAAGCPALEEHALVPLRGRQPPHRTVTDVTTPRTPSLPSASCSRSGPAAVAAPRPSTSGPRRRLQLERDDELVEAAVAGAGLAGAARGGVAPEAGVLVGLREVPERQAVRREQLAPQPVRARPARRSRSAPARRPRTSRSIRRRSSATTAAKRPRSGRDARRRRWCPPPKGTTRRPLGARLQHRRHLGRAAGQHDRVGRVEPAGAAQRSRSR